jgi:hypothetical protein
MNSTIRDRFDAKWTPEPFSGCWLWTGATKQHNYGIINKGARGMGVALAPRISWEIYNGEIPNGVQVLHRCDTPMCVNPDHLFLGNPRINKDDSMIKRRHNFGERNGNAKLTADEVREIRQTGDSCASIAKQYGVNRETIRLIRVGKNWRLVN